MTNTPTSDWAAQLERLRNRKPPTARVTICDDHTIKTELAQAREAHARAEAFLDAARSDKDAQARVKAAKTRLDKAQKAFDAEAIVLTFQALEQDALDALIKEHPPTEKQAEEEGWDFNPDTLRPVLIAACSVEGLTPDDVQHFRKTWTTAEYDTLAATVTNLQRDVRMDVGKG